MLLPLSPQVGAMIHGKTDNGNGNGNGLAHCAGDVCGPARKRRNMQMRRYDCRIARRAPVGPSHLRKRKSANFGLLRRHIADKHVHVG